MGRTLRGRSRGKRKNQNVEIGKTCARRMLENVGGNERGRVMPDRVRTNDRGKCRGNFKASWRDGRLD